MVTEVQRPQHTPAHCKPQSGLHSKFFVNAQKSGQLAKGVSKHIPSLVTLLRNVPGCLSPVPSGQTLRTFKALHTLHSLKGPLLSHRSSFSVGPADFSFQKPTVHFLWRTLYLIHQSLPFPPRAQLIQHLAHMNTRAQFLTYCSCTLSHRVI